MIMHLIKYLLAAFVLIAVQTQSKAQLTLQLQVPQAGLIQKAQLWNMSAVYLNNDNPSVTFQLTVTDRVSGSVYLTGISSVVHLKRGVQTLTEAGLGPVTYTFANPSANAGSSLLPAGLYQVCFTALPIEAEADRLAEECLPVDIEAMSPPLLTLPADSAILETPYPQFLWLPPTPLTIFNDLSYDILVTEVLPQQTPQEAIEQNLPKYSMNRLKENTTLYSAAFSALDTGKYYAWQIVAKNGISYGAKSDVWIFKIQQPKDSVKSNGTTYLLLSNKKETSGIYEVKGNDLLVKYFSYDAEHIAKLEIYKEGMLLKQVKHKLKYGENFFSLKLTGMSNSTGSVYTLQLKDRQGLLHSSSFIIENK